MNTKTSTGINTEIDTEQDYLFYSVISTLPYNTINLSNWERKNAKKCKENYVSDLNLVVTRKTYNNNLKLLENMFAFIHYNNPGIFLSHITKDSKPHIYKLLNMNLEWKECSTKFFYKRLPFIKSSIYSPPLPIDMLKKIPKIYLPNKMNKAELKDMYEKKFKVTLYVPNYLLPLYYAIIAILNKNTTNWTHIKEQILVKSFLFFYQFDTMAESKHITTFKEKIAPFTENNIFIFYYYLLEHYLPNQLCSLANSIQKRLDKLAFPKSEVTFISDVISRFYFNIQKNNDFFTEIEKYIKKNNMITYEQLEKYIALYEKIYQNEIDNFLLRFQPTFSHEKILTKLEESQLMQFEDKDSILSNAKTEANDIYNKRMCITT